MKYCPKCKYPNPDSMTKCFKCGTNLSLSDERGTESAQAGGNAVDDQQLQACPFCHGDVPQQARKCRHCGEWLVRRQFHLKILAYCLVLIALLSVVTTAMLMSRDKSPTSQLRTPIKAAAVKPTRVTVSQIRNNVLRYNKKEVRIKATIVDMATDNTRWVIADNWDAYFQAINHEFGVPSKGTSGDLYIYMSPKVPTLQVNDVVDLVGVYNADSNCLSVTSAKVVPKKKKNK